MCYLVRVVGEGVGAVCRFVYPVGVCVLWCGEYGVCVFMAPLMPEALS